MSSYSHFSDHSSWFLQAWLVPHKFFYLSCTIFQWFILTFSWYFISTKSPLWDLLKIHIFFRSQFHIPGIQPMGFTWYPQGVLVNYFPSPKGLRFSNVAFHNVGSIRWNLLQVILPFLIALSRFAAIYIFLHIFPHNF